MQWLWKEWNCMLRLRQDGVPIVGFTWYSLTDQIDWDVALRDGAQPRPPRRPLRPRPAAAHGRQGVPAADPRVA